MDFENVPKYIPNKKVKNLIYVGRLIYGKGVQDLLYAFSKLENKDLKLTIVGDGPYKEKLSSIVKNLNIVHQQIPHFCLNEIIVFKMNCKNFSSCMLWISVINCSFISHRLSCQMQGYL